MLTGTTDGPRLPGLSPDITSPRLVASAWMLSVFELVVLCGRAAATPWANVWLGVLLAWMSGDNSEVLPFWSVAVAVIQGPGRPSIARSAVKAAFPLPSVTTVLE